MADFLNAFRQGWGNAQQAQDDYYANRARRAAVQQYGDMAGDPVNALRVENYQHAKAMDPLLVNQQNLTNQGLSQRNNYLGKAYPQMLEKGQLGNENQRLQNTAAGQTIQSNNFKLSSAGAARMRTGLQTMVGGLRTSIANGADPGAAFDAALPHISAMTGVPVDQLKQYRAGFVANPQQELDTIQSQLTAANRGTLSPLDAAKVRSTNALTQQRESSTALNQARIGKTAQDQRLAAAKAGVDLPSLRSKYANMGQIQNRIELLGDHTDADGNVVPGQLSQALDAASNLSGFPGFNWLESEIGYGAGNRYYQLAQKVTHQLSLSDLQAMKHAGAFSGRVLKTEFEAFARAYANLDVSSNPQDLKNDLETIKRTLPHLLEGSRVALEDTAKKIRELGGVVPSPDQQSSPGGGAPSPAPDVSGGAAGAGGSDAAANPAAAPTIPLPGGGALDMGRAQQAIKGIESSGGNYGAIGPVTKSGDRAYGAYQVMGNNIPAWTKKYYGHPLTPKQFLANKAAQDAVFNGQFGMYARRYGPAGAAHAWFAGTKGMNNPNAKDANGTTVSGYGKQFMTNYANGTDQQQVASIEQPPQPDMPEGAGQPQQSGLTSPQAPAPQQQGGSAAEQPVQTVQPPVEQQQAQQAEAPQFEGVLSDAQLLQKYGIGQ